MFNKFQVVGDTKGAVFGGLVEAPLRPSTKKRYQVFLIEILSNLRLLIVPNLYAKLRYFVITIQGSNNTFVFTNASGPPVIFRPTGTAFSS